VAVKLKIPFVYSADAVAPGKRKQRRIRFVSELDVEIPSVSGGEASVVASWEHPDRYMEGGYPGCVRMFEGRLYARRSVWDDSECEFVPVSPTSLTVLDVTAPRVAGEGEDEGLPLTLEGCGTLTPEMCRFVEDCDREVVEEDLRQRFATLLEVDGHVWEPCVAPVVVVDFAYSTETVLRADASVFTDMRKCLDFLERLPREWHEKPVLLDRSRPELLEGLRMIVAERDRAYLPDFELDDIPVELCGRNFERDVASFARAMLGSLQRALEHYDEPSILNWVSARGAVDALEALIASNESLDEEIDTVLEALETVVHMTDGKATLRLDIVKRVWDAREISPRMQPFKPAM
jgi:hypothetical protein